MKHVPTPNEDNLRRRVERAHKSEQLITGQTARDIVAWLVRDIGPGLRLFAATGQVSGEFYAELARLYEHRRPEVEGWLDALAQWSVWRLRSGVTSRPAAHICCPRRREDV